jgi:hypothetical protein
MTHIETSRVNEALNLQIGAIRDYASKLAGADMAELEADLRDLELGIRDLKDILESLPHRHS